MARKIPLRPQIKGQDLFSLNNMINAKNLPTAKNVIEYMKSEKIISLNSTYVDLEELIKRNSEIVVISSDTLGENDGYIIKVLDDPARYEIHLNNKYPATRQRFTLAHEFAHYQLHRGQLQLNKPEYDNIMYRGDEYTGKEFVANQYASELLMPENIFKHILHNSGGSILQVAQKMKVSVLAVRYRAKQLGYSNHGL